MTAHHLSIGQGRKQVYLGIYKLEGDTLKWCVSPKRVRPKTFETTKGQFLLILRKDKEPVAQLDRRGSAR